MSESINDFDEDKIEKIAKIVEKNKSLPSPTTNAESIRRELEQNTGIDKEVTEMPDGSFQVRDSKIKPIYDKIVKVLKKYCDIHEENYNIIALWIIGTHIHKQFSTYPYLFFNAVKGSGKTRLLKLIAALSYHGCVLASLNEAVLFRTAADRTICIDEFEKIHDKEKSALRELLNAAYKKGLFVERIKKVKNLMEEKFESERFSVFCPIAMCNISGMDEVLETRCISLVLERSELERINYLIEDFDEDAEIKEIKRTFDTVSVVSVGCVSSQIYTSWNDYVLNLLNYTTQPTHTTQTTQTTQTTHMFEKIRETRIDGRHLEIFFPLFLLADKCNVLDETIKTAKRITLEKRREDVIESPDIALLEMLSNMEETINYIPIRDLTNQFRELQEGAEWISAIWVGRSLKRLHVIIDKRRINTGREVMINFVKVKERIKMFKRVEEVAK